MKGRRTRLGELFETTLLEDGRRISLELVIRRPDAEGPFPLVVFNHGSTGSGRNRKRFRETVDQPAITRYFNDRGWMVIHPQRRGRGKSDGRYDEGLHMDPAKGYACGVDVASKGLDRAIDDLDAVMACVRDIDDVQHDRVLMAGVSRGGALSVAYSGHAPDALVGVVSFSGGWLGSACPGTYEEVNRSVFLRGVSFGKPALWLCGTRDTYYGLAHCRSIHGAFVDAGGIGTFVKVVAGHGLVDRARSWAPHVDRFLADLALPD